MTGMPSLNALRAFHAVASLRSVTAAARELGVTPSAVSRQIRNLEESVGLALLVRERRGVRLTADGIALQSGLSEPFREIADAVDRLRQPVRGELLRIVVPPIFAAAWLVSRLERFGALRPGTEVILFDRDEPASITNGIDMIVSWGHFEDDAKTVAEQLCRSEEVFPVCSPRACGGSEGLAGATLLHYETVGDAWSWPGWPEFMEAVGIDGTETRDGPRLTPALLRDAALRGSGVMLANHAIAEDDLRAGRLIRPISECMPAAATYWLLTARTAGNRPEVQAFRSWLRDEFEAFSHRGRRVAE